jgi:hypothetical protein
MAGKLLTLRISVLTQQFRKAAGSFTARFKGVWHYGLVSHKLAEVIELHASPSLILWSRAFYLVFLRLRVPETSSRDSRRSKITQNSVAYRLKANSQ